ncbi:hypothetical protein VTK26DRAFT_4419 [Humicola hyalothermophila]
MTAARFCLASARVLLSAASFADRDSRRRLVWGLCAFPRGVPRSVVVVIGALGFVSEILGDGVEILWVRVRGRGWMLGCGGGGSESVIVCRKRVRRRSSSQRFARTRRAQAGGQYRWRGQVSCQS